MDALTATLVTVAIIAASGFFVSIEFAVIASRRPRLEAEATHSRAARAALRSASEVSVLLAGCQLGITACTLALGAVTKPAVEHALEPVLTLAGLPTAVATTVSFVLALLLVTFLHLVVGEMAPKSWAISHPERSAILFALPMRGFMWVFRPVLVLLNESANRLVRAVGVEPVDEVAVEQNPDDLRQLVQHSAETGDLDSRSSEQLSGALDTSRLTVGEVAAAEHIVSVPRDATVVDVRRQSLASGHLRIVVEGPDGPTGVVHVRDLLTAPGDDDVAPYVRDLHPLDPDMLVIDALTALREGGTQIAVVHRDGEGPAVVTVADLLSRVMPAAARAEGVAG